MADDGKINIDTHINTDGIDKGINKVNEKLESFANKVNNVKTEKAEKGTEKLNQKLDELSKKVNKVETKKAETGLDKLNKKLNGLTDNINKVADNKTLTSLSKLGSAVTGLQSAFSIITTAAGKALDVIKAETAAIKDTADAYNIQLKAETQLKVAVKNNPLLDSSAVTNLKNYASELQSVSTTGDEVLIPYMAELAASGRTEQEIMDIMSASLDVAASGSMSLESAVRNLNKTFGGYSGELGETNPKIKALTEQELKAGKAVEVLKEQYKGTSEEVAKSTGTYEQMKNAAGDFKEAVGSITKPTSDAWNNFWLGFYNKGIEVINKLNHALDVSFTGKDVAKQLATIEKTFKKGDSDYFMKDTYMSDYLKTLDQDTLLLARDYLSAKDSMTTSELKYYTMIKEQIKQNEEYEEGLNRLNELKNQDSNTDNNTNSNNKSDTRDALRDQYDETIRQAQEEIKQRRILGEEINEQKEAQLMLDTATSAYIQMMTDPAFAGNSGNYEHEVEARKQIAEWTEKAMTADESWLDKRKELVDSYGSSDNIDELRNQVNMINQLIEEANQEGVDISSDIWDTYYKKREDIEEKIAELIKNKNKETWQNVLSTMSEFVNAAEQIASNVSEMISENAEANETIQETALEKQYSEGLISEEEYYDQKEQIEKEYAQKEYQAQMWEWSSSLLQIGVSTAQAIVNALKTEPTALGIALASTMGVLGAAQLAAAVANKPIPPSYASGGVIGGINGASLGADNTYAHVRAGEMILNAKQQKELWATANGNGSASSGGNVIVKNYRGNDTSVSSSFDADGVKLIIRETVAESLRNRELNSSLKSAQNQMNGIRYLS